MRDIVPSRDASPPSSPSPQVEQQAIENLVALYQQAVLQEDIDRFETLLQSSAAVQSNQRQSSDPITSLSTLRDTLRSTFQQHTLSGLTIVADSLTIASDHLSVSFSAIENLAAGSGERTLVSLNEAAHLRSFSGV